LAAQASSIEVSDRDPAPGEDLAQEDLDTERLVGLAQAGDASAFPAIYSRYFDRVYAYLRVALNDAGEAEDATQRVFIAVLEALPKYVDTGRPFRAWLFRIARNRALDHRRSRGREEPEDPLDLDRRRDQREAASDSEMRALGWTTDEELLMLIERLPEVQRQALTLRYVLGFEAGEIAQIMDRSAESVRQLHCRALRFLEQRLIALGREPRGEPVATRRMAMRRRGRAGALRPAHAFTRL
jgi:RNA polymerase sigma-70 factor (ECF subfamily)